MRKDVAVKYDDQFVSISVNGKEVVYIDKHTNFEDIAESLYEFIDISDDIKSVTLIKED